MPQNLLSLLTNAIDLISVPYSDRGSRLMIFRDADDRFLIRLAERLTRIDPGIEAYIQRPPFIDQLALIDKNGAEIPYVLTWNPYGVRLKTAVGDFYLLIDLSDRLVIGIPDGARAGVRLRCNAGHYRETLANGIQKPVRELSWQVKGTVHSQKSWQEGESQWQEVLLAAGTDCAIALTISEEPVHRRNTLFFHQPPSWKTTCVAGRTGLRVFRRWIAVSPARLPMPAGIWPTI